MSVTEFVDISSKLKSLPMFQDFDLAQLRRLAEGLFFVRIKEGQRLFHFQDPAESCYLVSYGSLKLSRISPQKKEVTICFCPPGDFVGAAIMISPEPRYPTAAAAMEDSGLIQIPRRIYLDNWHSHPTINHRVGLQVVERMLEFHDDKAMSTSPVAQKIARFLIRTLQSQPPLHGNRVNLRLSRRDIAERVGTTVETVIRTMSKWSKDGLIHIEDQHIDILNRTALETISSE